MEHCSEIAKYTLMLELPWYEYRFYISLLVGSLICSLIPNRSKVIYVIMFNLFAVITYFLIDYIASQKIDKDKLTDLVDRCQTENNIKKENFMNKLNELTFENPKEEPSKVLNKDEENNFNERGSLSLDTSKNTIEKFENEVKVAGDYKDNISTNSFKNDLAVFESTYQTINTPEFPNPAKQVESTDCLLSENKCMSICSGNNNNPCNLPNSIPGPRWQPQSASSVQNRLNNGAFVPGYCPV